MKNANDMTNFETGNIYEMRFIGDSELKVQWLCVKMTPKTASFKCLTSTEVITRKIKTYNNCDYVLQGSYSMAPSISASRIVG